MLGAFGITVDRTAHTLTLRPAALTSPGRIELPGDFSSAAFWIVAAICVPGSTVTLEQVSLNPTRTRLLAILRRMGASIEQQPLGDAPEPRGTIVARASRLKAVEVSDAEVPGVIDELPILMVAAAVAQGRSVFRGLAELRVKETDRITSMVQGLSRMGVTITETGADSVEITGGPLTGAAVSSAGDHRTAMSLAVAGWLASGETRISHAECVRKS
jgi:3-phosphoshikimate 1-carboxyvinyltransferase